MTSSAPSERTNSWLPERAVVMTRFDPSMKVAAGFASKLRHLGVEVKTHVFIKDFLTDIDHTLSPEGCGRNAFVETERPIVVVIASAVYGWE